MQDDSMVENSSQDISAPEISTPAPSATAPSAPAEKMVTLPQSKIDAAIRHANARIAEKVRQEERAKWEQQAANAAPAQNSPVFSLDDVRRIAKETADEKQKEMLEAMQYHQNLQEGKRLEAEFYSKLDKADKNSYPTLQKNLENKQEFEKTLVSMGMGPVVAILTKMDNPAAVLNELFENPLKMTPLADLAAKQPLMAQAQLQRMADSIKLNQEAAKAKMPNEPLSRIEASNTVGMDSGEMSVSDFQKKYRNRR